MKVTPLQRDLKRQKLTTIDSEPNLILSALNREGKEREAMNREQRAKIATAIQLHVSICRFEAQVSVSFALHSSASEHL